MSYVLIEDFKLGLDRRRSRVAGVPGSLWSLVNAHITRGGEIERMKKPVATYSLPAGTFGLAEVDGDLYVFGSAADPGVPSGVIYQRLQHPDNTPAMTAVRDVAQFDGKLYVIAEFDDGLLYHFYDGALVADWHDGRVRAAMADNDGIAAHLADLIDADDEFSATSSGAVVTVTGPSGQEFDISAMASDGGGTDDQTATVATTQEAREPTAEVLSTGTVEITGGEEAAASSGFVDFSGSVGGASVDSITVDGVEVLGATVNGLTTVELLADDVAAQINSFTSSPNYTAVSSATVVYIYADESEGANPNGYAVVASTTGGITATETDFSGGTNNHISDVRVDGVSIIDNPVWWRSGNSATATALAAEINSSTSNPSYTATAEGPVVTISALAGTGKGPNGFRVTATVLGDVTTATTDMTGGVDEVTALSQISTVTIGGTFEPGDRFGVTIDDGEPTEKNFGAAGNPEPVGDTIYAFYGKLYSTAGSLLHFSDVDSATRWNRERVDTAGAGFINASSQTGGSFNLQSVREYQGQLALFSRRNIQVWTMASDPGANVITQTLQKTGTLAGKSALAYGALDVFYLDEPGIRTLRARDSSNAAYVNDVGIALDKVIRDYLSTLTDEQIASARAMLEPRDGRYYLAIGQRVFVFSYFPGSKINAWSEYRFGFDIDEMIDSGARVYVRSGDTIYLLGGADDTTYPGDDEFPITIELPFVAENRPATLKKWNGFDIACSNEWDIFVLPDPNDDTIEYRVGTVNRTTFARPRVAMELESTHIAARLVCARGGEAVVSQIVFHNNQQYEAG